MSTVMLYFIYYNKRKITTPLFNDIFSKSGIDIGVKNVHLMSDKNGNVIWELTAKTVSVDNNNAITILEDIKAKFYPEGKTVYYLTAKNGVMHNKDKTGELSNDITIVSDNGDRLTTNSLKWDSVKEVIEGNDSFLYEGKGLKVQGKGFRYYLGSTTLHVLDNVMAEIL